MRVAVTAAISIALSACGPRGPDPVPTGPRLTATLEQTWPARGPARQAAFSRDGRLLATSDAGGLIQIRDAADWKVREQLRHPGGATSVAFSSNGGHLYSGGYDGRIRDWDLGRHGLARTMSGARGTIWTLDLSPNGRRLAAAGEDAVIRIWDLNHRGGPTLLQGHRRNVWQVAFRPDGKELASGSFDSDVRLWQTDTGKSLKTLTGHSQAVVGLDYSPDGMILATGSDDSTIRFWRVSDGAQMRVIDNGRHVDTVAVSPDGRWLASGGHARGELATLWHQLTGGGPDGDSVRIWRVSDGALVARLPHPDDVICVSFSPDGHWLITSGEDGRFRLWRLRPVAG